MRGLVVFAGESTEISCLYHYERSIAGKLQKMPDESISMLQEIILKVV